MSKKHTPGPWQKEFLSVHVATALRRVCIFAEKLPICIVYGNTNEEAIANADRIVACVNACEGIASPAMHNVNH